MLDSAVLMKLMRRLCKGGEFEQEEIDRLYWEEVEELFAECLELGRDSSADDEQEVEVFPAEEEEEEEEEAEEDEEEP